MITYAHATNRVGSDHRKVRRDHDGGKVRDPGILHVIQQSRVYSLGSLISSTQPMLA